jgi:hypothetical protein
VRQGGRNVVTSHRRIPVTRHERLGFVALVGFAAAGTAALIFKILHSARGEDGPIRVKGGSVTVENDDLEWLDDDEDDKKEYYLRRRSTVRARIWLNEPSDYPKAPKPPEKFAWTGRRLIVFLENGDKLVFRANGALRVKDPKDRLTPNGKVLRDDKPGTRIEKVEVWDRKQDPNKPLNSYEFATDEKGFIELTLV